MREGQAARRFRAGAVMPSMQSGSSLGWPVSATMPNSWPLRMAATPPATSPLPLKVGYHVPSPALTAIACPSP